MPLNWDDVNDGIKDAAYTIRQADNRVRDMANLIKGKLRICNVLGSTLCALKKELARYNMRTGIWRD